MVPLLKPNIRKKGTLIIQGSLRNLVWHVCVSEWTPVVIGLVLVTISTTVTVSSHAPGHGYGSYGPTPLLLGHQEQLGQAVASGATISNCATSTHLRFCCPSMVAKASDPGPSARSRWGEVQMTRDTGSGQNTCAPTAQRPRVQTESNAV